MPDQPPQPEQPAVDVRKHRKFGDEEFKAKLEMTKSFCDTAKSYVQISSAGVALPLLFKEAMLGKTNADKGLLGSCPWTLVTSWVLFLFAIGLGLTYQWLSMRRLWDQYHAGNWTPENAHEPGYRTTKGILKTEKINLSWVWLGMTGTFYLGAIFFVIYASLVIAGGKIVPQSVPQNAPSSTTSARQVALRLV
jgi:hypothetical protein